MSNLDEFGKIFVSEVRDNTISVFNRIFDGSMGGETAKKVREWIADFDEMEQRRIQDVISSAVDQCLHNMLFMAEQHEDMEFIYHGDNLVEESDGLAGELYTEDGWIEKYSQFPCK